MNAVQFDIRKFERRRRARRRLAVLHRIDGPIHLYRGTQTRDLDEKTYRLNRAYAGATVIQSFWNLKEIVKFPYQPVLPVVVHNAADPAIFHRAGRTPFDRNRRIRIIASSWSANPRKGGAVYKWLEEHLDWERYEFTVVGNLSEELDIANHLPPMNSESLAEVLRQHDIYITSQPSRSVLECARRGSVVRLAGAVLRRRRTFGTRRLWRTALYPKRRNTRTTGTSGRFLRDVPAHDCSSRHGRCGGKLIWKYSGIWPTDAS